MVRTRTSRIALGVGDLAEGPPGTLYLNEGTDDMHDEPPRRDNDVLAGRLAEAGRLLSQLSVPGDVAERLHRQFIAVCDAVKAPGADVETGLRRLAAFLATLERAASRGGGNKSQTDRSAP